MRSSNKFEDQTPNCSAFIWVYILLEETGAACADIFYAMCEVWRRKFLDDTHIYHCLILANISSQFNLTYRHPYADDKNNSSEERGA